MKSLILKPLYLLVALLATILGYSHSPNKAKPKDRTATYYTVNNEPMVIGTSNKLPEKDCY